MTLIERIDHLKKLAEAEASGKKIQSRPIGHPLGWSAVANGFTVETLVKYIIELPHCYRIAPEPVARPWSKPEDVPGPVCWVRSAITKTNERLILVVDAKGVHIATISGGHSDYFRWLELRQLEHSTDRKTWLPCTVTDPA